MLVFPSIRKGSLLCAQDKRVRIPLRFFNESQAPIIAAAASRIFPSDDSGPGAREAALQPGQFAFYGAIRWRELRNARFTSGGHAPCSGLDSCPRLVWKGVK